MNAKSNNFIYKDYPYSIENREGILLKSSIQLNSTPRKILESMSSTISFPPPPEGLDETASNIDSVSIDSIKGKYNSDSQKVDDLIQNAGMFGFSKTTSRTIRDCNLLNFLQHMNPNDIKTRKLDRINATAAALVARRSWKLSAIDGTGLGWSSASMAILLNKLTELHDEHKSKLQTKSFYPFRLVFSGDEFNKKVDVYSGVILLNPAATPLQWLDTLQTITDESVTRLKHNRLILEQNLSLVESQLNVRVRKGYSCEPSDYHHFIAKMAMASVAIETDEKSNTSLTSHLNDGCLVIESSQACRRCSVRKGGNIEAGVGMEMYEIRNAIYNYAAKSNEYKKRESRDKREFKKLEQRVVYEFGVQNVQKVSSIVTYDQMCDCLIYLLRKKDDEKEKLRHYIAGQSVGITGRGQPCHLGDDGSIQIPWNVQ